MCDIIFLSLPPRGFWDGNGIRAALHDIGDFVGYESHHKHTYYLVVHSEIMGLTPVAKEIIANVASLLDLGGGIIGDGQREGERVAAAHLAEAFSFRAPALVSSCPKEQVDTRGRAT
jgi:hypothetical protein